MDSLSPEEKLTTYYFNSTEEHLSTLTIHYVANHEVKEIHLVDVIWFECNKTEDTEANDLIIDKHPDSMIKKNYQALISLCQLFYEDVQHVIIRFKDHMIQALVTDVHVIENINNQSFYLYHITQKVTKEKNTTKPPQDWFSDYKNFGRTEVVFLYDVAKNILVLKGHFQHSTSFKSETIALIFRNVQKITHNPISTVNKTYGDAIIYLMEADTHTIFTCFSALRDPIEIIAESVELMNDW